MHEPPPNPQLLVDTLAARLAARGDSTIVVVRGGPAPDPRAVSVLSGRIVVLAVDRGYEHAVAAGLHVDAVIGDLDSVTPETRDTLSRSGIDVLAYPTDKNATDLELALELALAIQEHAAQPLKVLVLGGPGWEDRLDHLVGQFGLLASPRWSSMPLHALLGTASIRPVHPRTPTTFTTRPGATVSLVPVGGLARGVRTEGLRYALDGDDLDPFATRGISNEATSETVTVTLDAGVLLVIVANLLDDIRPPVKHQ